MSGEKDGGPVLFAALIAGVAGLGLVIGSLVPAPIHANSLDGVVASYKNLARACWREGFQEGQLAVTMSRLKDQGISIAADVIEKTKPSRGCQ